MTLSGINQLWVADITYIRLEAEFVYLAVVIDAFSRRVIGWALDRSVEDELTLAALRMALELRRPPAGCVHHSDRGSQYASGDYTGLLKTHGCEISMSHKSSPWEKSKMPKEPPAEIMALINTALDAFNRKDPAVFSSVFGDDVVIIDGFAPFRWLGPRAVERWWNDAETWAKAGGVQKEHISLEKIHYGDVSGTRAYAVFSATLTITLKEGEPIVRPGILVYTFSRQGDAWKAEGHMWGRLD